MSTFAETRVKFVGRDAARRRGQRIDDPVGLDVPHCEVARTLQNADTRASDSEPTMPRGFP